VELVVKRRVDRAVWRDQKESMAVRRRAHDCLGTYVAAAARPVVDDEGLAGGMGKAARRLNTSQSAISRSIAELEHAFGVRLLDRSRQGVEPTQYGRALLGCGAAVFDELR